MSRSAVAEELGIPYSFALEMEKHGLVAVWPAPDVERYRARLLLIRGARKAGVPLSRIKLALKEAADAT